MDRRAFLAASGSFLVLPSCVSKPTMQLHHAAISSAGPAGIGMNIVLRVHNDNKFDVQVRNVRVQTVMQDRWRLAPVNYSPNLWLPAKQTTLVHAPVIIPWAMVPPLLAETAMNPSIRYHVTGEADVTAIRSVGIKSNNYPVDEEGSVPRAAILAAAQPMFPFLR